MYRFLITLLGAISMVYSPAAIAQTDPHKAALVLVEFQNDWMAPDGGINAQFKDRAQFDASKANAARVLADARRRGLTVIYVTMTLDPSFQVLGQAKYGLRAMMPQYKSFLGKQAAFFPGFEPRDGEYVIRERSGSSAFGGTTLDSYLRNNHIEDIYLMGYALHLCVESTLRQGHDLGYNTTVIYDASAAFTREQQVSFLADIVPFYGRAMTTGDFLKGSL